MSFVTQPSTAEPHDHKPPPGFPFHHNTDTATPSDPSMFSFGISPITCHVLNTTTGQPAASMPVKLEFAAAAPTSASSHASQYHHPHSWAALTNENGRVTEWRGGKQNEFSLQDLFEKLRKETQGEKGEAYMWRLVFVTEGHLGEESWWSDIDIKFKTVLGGDEQRAHWHVPLLIGPFAYTTYRGS